MDFIPGDFVSYYYNDIPYHAIVKMNDFINKECLVCTSEYSGYVRIKSDKLTLVKLSIEKKLYILGQFDDCWVKENKRLFTKILTDAKIEYNKLKIN
tara:strand:+ start:243 stop:533 length:291 start_codon:yes stop_codon:yes gene_type:complete